MGRNMTRKSIYLALFLVLSACKKHEDSVSKVLKNCDFKAECVSAFNDVLKDPNAFSETTADLAVKVGLSALTAFPPDSTILKSLGLYGDRTKLLTLVEHLGKSRAKEILGYIEKPDCEGFSKMKSLMEGGGEYSEFALSVVVSRLAELLASLVPQYAHEAGEAGKIMVGCLGEDARDGVGALVKVRQLLKEALEECGEVENTQVRRTCLSAQKLLLEKPLSLPLPEVVSGQVFSCVLPSSLREAGVVLTPPWVLVLSAGRIGLFKQQVLQGDAEFVQAKVKWFFDLRKPQALSSLALALKEEISSLSFYEIGGLQVYFVVADKDTTWKEFSSLLEAMLSVSDAVAMLGVAHAKETLLFIPFNYRERGRRLLGYDGREVTFGEEKGLLFEIDPFSAILSLGQEGQRVEIGSEDQRDLRGVYQKTMELTNNSPVSCLFKPGEAVRLDLIVALQEAVSFKVSNDALSSHLAFAKAPALRGERGHLEPLCRVVVHIR
jgi:hypothetical protein